MPRMNGKTIRLPERPRILVARTDRIGDVALSLPVFASLRRAYPEARIVALSRDYTKSLFEMSPDVDDVIHFDSDNAHVPIRRFVRLAREIRSEKFDVAIALYLNFSVGALLAFGGVPRRVGPATKAAQIFLTDKVVQRRSKSARHEVDHNLDLLIKLLGVAPVRQASIDIPKDRSPRYAGEGGRFLVGVHPGHGGSSRNWPERNYSGLIARLKESGVDVVVTGAGHERDVVERVMKNSGVETRAYIGDGDLAELASVLSEFDVFVASSTGPLHMATVAGAKAVGIYCPISVCLPQRWGPIGLHDTAIIPDVDPCESCVEDKCPHFDCMDSITVERVRDEVMKKINIAACA